eukprot:TRINITY_DN1355_c0_g1_i1.p1 TRINITY_DN1355_c0_g1~~TRINITY_DN1355_c0_g1_i1.p1  ORF type:complete len:590 (+),score=139.24 TRINITY_DN1355_c0_g1_i1:120-1889(+)
MKGTAALFDDVEEKEVCLGKRCFHPPHANYKLPQFFDIPLQRGERVAGRDYRWKTTFSLRDDNVATTAKSPSSLRPRVAVQKGWALPHLMGLGDDARWRWQFVPVSILAGVKLDFWRKKRQSYKRGADGAEARQGEWDNVSSGDVNCTTGKQQHHHSQFLTVAPSVRVKVLTPLCGKLALKPSLELLPVPALSVKRVFSLGTAKLSVRARIEAGNSEGVGALKLPRWALQVDWWPADTVRVLPQPDENLLTVKYTKGIRFTPHCNMVIGGQMDVPSRLSSLDLKPSRPLDLLPLPRNLRMNFVKVRHILGTRGKRDPPKRTQTYLTASRNIGKHDVISVIPGHWIDPGLEPGAPGEREFNLEVANAVERQLRWSGWEVLRPDRDAPHLRWEEYLNWVSHQTLKGVPVMEVHGQGSTADYRGLVLGVIGDKDAPLNRELAANFGMFAMDWRDLAVPRRGGVILESFNSDEVLEMAPWHRTWAVSRLASRISRCIERASYSNRSQRGRAVPPGALEDVEQIQLSTSSKGAVMLEDDGLMTPLADSPSPRVTGPPPSQVRRQSSSSSSIWNVWPMNQKQKQWKGRGIFSWGG